MKIEDLLWKVVGEKVISRLFRHKNSENIFASFLDIFISSKKPDYAKKEDILNTGTEKEKTIDYYKKCVFRPVCPVCKKKKSIALNDSTIAEKYKKPDEIIRYIRKNKKTYAEFICKSCRDIDSDKIIFVRQVDKIPKTNFDKNTSFLWIYKKYIEAEEGGFDALLTDEIITSIGGSDAK